MNQDTHKKYNLLTAVTMIVGVCIGSGIFFKSDNILVATNGSVFLGVVSFVMAAFAIIFGSLTFSELASRTDEVGGIITYMDIFVNKELACGFGWFQIFVYFPTIVAVVSWVVGIYIDILFAMNASLQMQILMGFVFVVVCFIYNVLTPKLGSLFQDVATFVKLMPLFLLGILGIIYGDPLTGLTQIDQSSLLSSSWLMALGPIAYSFDGWVVSISIAHEIKDSKRNLPRALTIAPLIILAIYVLYFVGVSCYIGPEEIMRLGDAHVSIAASQLLGSTFAKLMTVFIVISVMGTVNGLITGFIRMPYSLAIRDGMIPFSRYLKKVNTRLDMPVYSAIVAFGISVFWIITHYFCTEYNLLPNSDVSEIAITISYLFYVILYYQVYKLYKKKVITSRFKGVICPIFATIGSMIILSGAMQNKLMIYYVIFCAIIYAISQIYYKRHQK